MKTATSRLSLMADVIVLTIFSILGTGFTRKNGIRLKTRGLSVFLFAIFLANAKVAIGQAFVDHPVVYQQDGLIVMTGREASDLKAWCTTTTSQYMYVFYDAPHTQRPAAISTDIETFARDTIYPRIKEICGSAQIKKISFLRYRIGEDENGPAWDSVTLDVLDNGRSLVVSEYYPSDAAKAVLTMEQIAQMMPKEQLGSIDRGEPLYDDAIVKIYPYEKGENWCISRQNNWRPQHGPRVAIVFSVPYSKLRSVLSGEDYFRDGGFAYGVILPLLNKHQCISRVSAFFYEKGKLDYAERVDYGPDNTPFNPKFVELSRSYGRTVESQLNKIERQQQRLSAWDIPCDGPFCDVPGGAYLNAVFRGDASSLKKMDAIADKAVKGRLQGTGRVSGMIAGVIERAEQQESARDFSLLPIVANRYFFNYQSTFALYCPDGLVRKRVDYATETYEEYDESGLYAGVGGGETISAHYVIKPEFAPLCERVCDALGGDSEKMLIDNTGHEPSKMTLNGLDTMMDRYHCEDATVRQFERNLVLLTEQSLRGWKDGSEQPVKASAPEITAPQSLTVTPPVTSSDQETPSPATSDSGNSNSIAPTQSRQLSKTETVEPRKQQRLQNQTAREQRSRTTTSIEKQQAMMAEIKAFTEEMTKTHQAKLQEFVTRLKNNDSMEERTKITQEMKTFQESTAQELQKAMAEIQQRYQ